MERHLFVTLALLAALAILVLLALSPGTAPVGRPALADDSVPEVVTRTYYLPMVARKVQGPRKCIMLNGGTMSPSEAHANILGAKCFTIGWHQLPTFAGLESVAGLPPSNHWGEPISATSTYVLAQNEPELIPQTVTETAIFHRNAEATYPGWLLTSPCMSHVGGALYLRGVYSAYVTLYDEPPPWSALCIHCYGNKAECQPVVEGIIALGEDIQVHQIWLSEFARHPCCGIPQETVVAQAAELMAWVDANPHISRYFWFNDAERGDEPWRVGAPLFEWGTNTLTPMGVHYQALDPTN